LRTDYIKTALKVAETGHFNTASKELFMAEMTAFMRIRILEQELGFKLFDRPKYHLNPVVPTLQGAKWLTLARRALELLDQGTVEMKVSGEVNKQQGQNRQKLATAGIKEKE
jgi:DNA-binding transcriptional LysR family regulator